MDNLNVKLPIFKHKLSVIIQTLLSSDASGEYEKDVILEKLSKKDDLDTMIETIDLLGRYVVYDLECTRRERDSFRSQL